MRVVLLGRDGQVGKALAPALARLGEVIALGHAEADFERSEELGRLVTALAPAVIVNAAAYTAVDRAESEPGRARLVNAVAPAQLAEAARQTDAWLIHYSTDYVFDGGKDTPYAEADRPVPLGAYGTTKLEGDLAIMRSGCRHLIFRIGWVYGAGATSFPAAMLRLARDRTTLRVVADQVGTPTAAEFVAEVTATAIARLADTAGPPAAGLYHLAPMGAVSRADFARFVLAEARRVGLDLPLGPEGIADCASADYPTPARRPLNCRLDTSRIRSAFGLDLRDWREDARRWVAETVEAVA